MENLEIDNQDMENPQLLNTNNTKDLIKLNTNNKTEEFKYTFELNLEISNFDIVYVSLSYFKIIGFLSIYLCPPQFLYIWYILTRSNNETLLNTNFLLVIHSLLYSR